MGMEDEDDDDYDVLNNSCRDDSNKLKTRMDMQNEVLYLKEVLHYLNGANPNYYHFLMSLLDDKLTSLLNYLFENIII
jgi:hypothetical protein